LYTAQQSQRPQQQSDKLASFRNNVYRAAVSAM